VQTEIGSAYTYLTVNLEWTMNAERIRQTRALDGVGMRSEKVPGAKCTVICIKL